MVLAEGQATAASHDCPLLPPPTTARCLMVAGCLGLRGLGRVRMGFGGSELGGAPVLQPVQGGAAVGCAPVLQYMEHAGRCV